jgi:hypothetical protein
MPQLETQGNVPLRHASRGRPERPSSDDRTKRTGRPARTRVGPGTHALARTGQSVCSRRDVGRIAALLLPRLRGHVAARARGLSRSAFVAIQQKARHASSRGAVGAPKPPRDARPGIGICQPGQTSTSGRRDLRLAGLAVAAAGLGVLPHRAISGSASSRPRFARLVKLESACLSS